jgi:hypothetical protein
VDVDRTDQLHSGHSASLLDVDVHVAALAVQAPAHATLVVFHCSVLYQVAPQRRLTFVDLVGHLPGHWVAVEAPDVLTYEHLPEPPDDGHFNVLAPDGGPLAWTRGHGQGMVWFG